jgi:hypothetical protein
MRQTVYDLWLLSDTVLCICYRYTKTAAGGGGIPVKDVLDAISSAALRFDVPSALYAVACYASEGESSLFAPNVTYYSAAFGIMYNNDALTLLSGLRGLGPVDAAEAHRIKIAYP